jgi:hypothetical protein
VRRSTPAHQSPSAPHPPNARPYAAANGARAAVPCARMGRDHALPLQRRKGRPTVEFGGIGALFAR